MECPTEAQLELLAEGRLDAAEAELTRAHLEECRPCSDVFEECRANHLFELGVRRVLPATHLTSLEDAATQTGFYRRFLDEPASLRPGQAVPGYRILRELHAGGQGVVYEAIQESVGRRVALKVIRGGLLAGDDSRRRFEREVELAASLHHPNIITIHDSGVHSGCCYFAMKYVEGQHLDAYLSAREVSLEDKLALFRTICDAVHHAHQRGVIHRDLKPSNILVTPEGSPCVLDFGLAKAIDQPDHTQLSIVGQVMGTLAYMSPEQARGEQDLDTRSDVYALGVILFRMLTGRFPYEVHGPLTQVLRTIAESPPARPMEFDARIDDELETILLKTLSKDRERRYDSPAELAEDLRLYLLGEAIEAKRDSSFYVLKKALKRHRLAVAVAASVLAIVSVSITSLAFAHRETRDAKAAEASQRRRLAQQTYASSLNLAYRAWDEANLRLTLDMLGRYETDDGPGALRGFEWHLLRHLCSQEQRRLQASGTEIVSLSYPDDGRLVAVLDGRGDITLWDTAAWTSRVIPNEGAALVRAIAVSHHAELLATGSTDAIIRLYDLASGRLVSTLAGHVGPITALAFAHDDRTLAAASGERWGEPCDRLVWDLRTGQSRGPMLPEDSVPTKALALTPDGRTVVVGGTRRHPADGGKPPGMIRLIDVTSARVVQSLPEQETQARSLAVSPDGRILAASAGAWNITGSVQLWELPTGRLHRTLRGHRAQVLALAFSPDSRTLATASQDSSVRLWDTATGDECGVIRGHSGWSTAAGFLAQGRQVITASRDGQLKLWDVSRVTEVHRLKGHDDEVWGVGFSPDGSLMASASRDQTVNVWNTSESESVIRLPKHSCYGYKALFSPDGRTLATLGCEVKLWETSSFREQRVLPSQSDHATAGAFTPDGRTLAVTYRDSVVILWDVTSGRERLRLRGHGGEVYGAAITPDGKVLVTSGGKTTARDGEGEIIFWDVAGGGVLRRLDEPAGWVLDVAVSPDGRYLASGGFDQTVSVRGLPDAGLLHVLRGHANTIGGVAFTLDGRTLASGSWDDTVKLWHVVTGQELATLRAFTNGVTAVSFHPAGQTLAAAGRDGSVRLWPTGTSLTSTSTAPSSAPE